MARPQVQTDPVRSISGHSPFAALLHAGEMLRANRVMNLEAPRCLSQASLPWAGQRGPGQATLGWVFAISFLPLVIESDLLRKGLLHGPRRLLRSRASIRSTALPVLSVSFHK